jgi:hypothetical protein
MFAREYDWSMGVEKALLCVYEAKVDAEYATDVGTETDIYIINKDGMPLRIGDNDQRTLEKIRKELAPREFKDKHKNAVDKIQEIGILKRLIDLQ